MTYLVTDACVKCKFMDCIPADREKYESETGKFEKYFSENPGTGDE